MLYRVGTVIDDLTEVREPDLYRVGNGGVIRYRGNIQSWYASIPSFYLRRLFFEFLCHLFPVVENLLSKSRIISCHNLGRK